MAANVPPLSNKDIIWLYRPTPSVTNILDTLLITVFSIQESVDLRRQAVMSNQIIDARGRKFSKRLVDIRELNEQAKVIDDLK